MPSRPPHPHRPDRAPARRARPVLGALALAVALVVPVSTAAPAARAEPPRLLAGVLAADPALLGAWSYCGTWVLPVGDPRELGRGCEGAPGYAINRGVVRREGAITHQGADLCNRRAGGVVRAAANGIVAFASAVPGNGYGQCAVIAHHDPGGGTFFSVYAHLAAGSMRVRPGDPVQAGEPIGRVGRTGRATTDHLHFEVRRARDPWERWERAAILDPVEFVARASAPGDPDDDRGFGPFHAWGLHAALLEPGELGGEALTRLRWWRMLARAARSDLAAVPEGRRALRAALEAAGVLAADGARRDGRLGREELESDLARLIAKGLRLPPWAVGAAAPAANASDAATAAAAGAGDAITIADACAALAAATLPIAAETSP